ncbi:MAG: ion channel [Terriglobia bacterium]
MAKPAYDPGLTRQFDGSLHRVINQDGSFNVRRLGVGWRAFHPWLHVINMSWTGFFTLVLGSYLGINTIFAAFYFLLPPDSVQGSAAPTEAARFLNDFFFSGHTLTTVGYGSLTPRGDLANIVALTEALAGLMAFAMITGTLVARASRPSARIGYSSRALVAPYQNGAGLMFRIANERSNSLMELEASVMLMTVTRTGAAAERKFDLLALERSSVLLFPLSWTIVHPIDEKSPFHGKTAEDLRILEAELIILIKGFDETFGQVVHSRYSYRFDEIVWGAKFLPAFRSGPEGNILLEVYKLGDFIPVPVGGPPTALPGSPAS